MGKCILAGHPQIGGGTYTSAVGYGTYTGTGGGVTQTINLGVTPKWVLVVNAAGDMGTPGSGSTTYGGLALEGFPANDVFRTNIITIVSNGFTITKLANATDLGYNPYRYIYGY